MADLLQRVAERLYAALGAAMADATAGDVIKATLEGGAWVWCVISLWSTATEKLHWSDQLLRSCWTSSGWLCRVPHKAVEVKDWVSQSSGFKAIRMLKPSFQHEQGGQRLCDGSSCNAAGHPRLCSAAADRAI